LYNWLVLQLMTLWLQVFLNTALVTDLVSYKPHHTQAVTQTYLAAKRSITLAFGRPLPSFIIELRTVANTCLTQDKAVTTH